MTGGDQAQDATAPDSTKTPEQVSADLAAAAAEMPEVAAPPAKPLKAVVVVGAGPIPKGYDLAIVAESRAVTPKEDGSVDVAIKTSGYPKGADAYLRYDERVAFPADAVVLTMGAELKQHNFAGFTRIEGFVNVGPAHPAYAAANVAFQRGATAIDIMGLDDADKVRLGPWFNSIPSDAVEPAQVTVSFL